jgi:hypothetical protein
LVLAQGAAAEDCPPWTNPQISFRPTELKKSAPRLENAQTSEAQVHTTFTKSYGIVINTWYHLDGAYKGLLECVVNNNTPNDLYIATYLINNKQASLFKIPPRKSCRHDFHDSDMDKIDYFPMGRVQ